MRWIRSVGAQLSAALVALVALALGIVYLIVVPSLERNLVNEKLAQLEQSAATIGAQYPGNTFEAELYVAAAAFITNSRVILFEPLVRGSNQLQVFADEPARLNTNSEDVVTDQIALRSTLSGVMESGIIERRGARYAEVAVPVSFDGAVLLFSANLTELFANVDLVERRLLIAGGLALVIALLLGYGGAWAFARRIRRLERAADRIASGRLDEPVVDLGSDELGQLARAFERMRGRLSQLERARREFIANASHELRTPIFALGGFLELLADEELDERTRAEFLATMHEQVERLQKLATDLLDLSRLDAGRLHVEREPLDLAAVGSSLVDEFAAVARTTDHELEAIQDGPAVALADELRVLQIGSVLIQNALIHTPVGTAVRVRTSASGTVARLLVEDSGPGISPDDAEHVFDRFYRVDGSIASGSGLGLAIARELAELMGGTLELHSRPFRTTFTLELPVAAAIEREVRETVLA